MGLSDRFSGEDNSKEIKQNKQESSDKVEAKSDPLSSGTNSAKSSDNKTDSNNSSGSSGNGGNGSSLMNNPYAQNLKDVLTGKKSKEQAALDAGKHAIKQHGGKLLGQGVKSGLKAAAQPAAQGLLYLYMFQRALNLMQAMMNAFLQSPLVNALLNVVGMIMSAAQSVGSFFAGVGHAIAGAAHAVAHGIGVGLNAIGSFASGIAHAIGGGSAAASAVSISSQVATISVIPMIALAFASGAFNDKASDDSGLCSVDSATETPHYGKLGSAQYYQNDLKKTALSMYKALKKGGYTDRTAFALIGNWQAESTLNPKAQNGKAYGITQWLGNRVDGSTDSLTWYASKHHGSKSDLGIQLGFADYELQHSYNYILKAADKAKSLDAATEIFFDKYEAPGDGTLPKRQEYAAQWEKSLKGDSSSAGTNDLIAAVQEALGCGDSAEDTADWSGSIKEAIPENGSHYKWDSTPKDIKKYIHDPNDVGMKFDQGGEGWFLGGAAKGNNNSTEQCVIFAESYFLKIHGLPASNWVSGNDANGQDMVRRFSQELGGKGTGTPHQGDIASVKGGSTGGALEAPVDGTYYGHTFIVSHVLQNGDLIGLEENMAWSGENLSGTYTNSVTWDTILLKKDTYKKWGIKFYHPDEKKHPLKWSTSSKK